MAHSWLSSASKVAPAMQTRSVFFALSHLCEPSPPPFEPTQPSAFSVLPQTPFTASPTQPCARPTSDSAPLPFALVLGTTNSSYNGMPPPSALREGYNRVASVARRITQEQLPDVEYVFSLTDLFILFTLPHSHRGRIACLGDACSQTMEALDEYYRAMFPQPSPPSTSGAQMETIYSNDMFEAHLQSAMTHVCLLVSVHCDHVAASLPRR
jgi:hypothetical protein